MSRDPISKSLSTVAVGHPDDDLKAYADGELSPLRRAVVRRHVARCAQCQQEVETMKKLSVTFAAADKSADGAAALAPHIRARMLGQMQAAVSASHPASRRAPLWRRSPILVFGSGAFAALAMLAIFLPMFNNREEDNQIHSSGMFAPRTSENAPQASGGAVSGAATNGSAASAVEVEDANGLTALAPGASEHSALGAPSIIEDDGRQVHKEGSIGVVIAGGKLESTSDKVEEIARTAGGFVASNNLQTSASDGYKSADLVIKVPVQDFEDVMKRLAKLGEVVAKSVNGEDITEKTSDAVQAEQTLTDEARTMETRLKRESLSDRRATQKEQELRQVKIQLAQTRARLHLLRRLGALATITVSLTERPKTASVVPQTGFLADLGETNRAAAAAFQSAVRVPIVLVVWILAFSPIWGTLLLAYRWASVRSDRAALAANAAVSATQISPDA